MISLMRTVRLVALALLVAVGVVVGGQIGVALGQAGDEAPVVPSDASGDLSLAEQEVFGFLPHWEMRDADSIDLEALTTLAWFGVEAGADGWLVRRTDSGGATAGWAGWTGEAFTALRERAQQAGVRVVLTVERFSWDAAGEETTIALLADPVARATLVRDIVASVTVRGADGVNLDFEPLPEPVGREFVEFVRELRAGLDAADPALQLTFDLPPSIHGYWLRPLTADDAADAVVLMGYEYRNASSRVAGSVAPLRDPDGPDLRDSVQRVRRRVPADKVILALPWYGRAWATRDADQPSKTRQGDRFIGSSVASYEVSVARAASAGRMYDPRQASAWSAYLSAACDTCRISWRQLWYDDIDAVRAKVRFAVRRGLRGVGIWALGHQGDRSDLWSALRFGLTGASDDAAPTGQVALAPQSVLGMHEGVPVVGDSVVLHLQADDEPDGSGLAYVQVAPHARMNRRGSLRQATTFPAVDVVSVSMPSAGPVEEVFVPGVDELVRQTPPPKDAGPVTLRVQWRDVAGNWSTPEALRVFYDPRYR